MHGIYVGELQALEGAGRSLWDFPDAPWEFKMNMARQCWDEARHVQIYEKLLEHVGGTPGMFPESTFLFECACSDDPAMRVAGVNRGLEGLACDVFRDMIRYAEQIGDEKMRQAIDFVLADELTHVRFGSEWVKEFTKDDPERFKRTQEFRKQVDKQFSFGGARSDREDAAIPIAWQDRKEAGFSDEELRELTELSGGGPSKQTLLAAARILRERHLRAPRGSARRGGRSVSEPRLYPGTGPDERTTFAAYGAFEIPADLRELSGRFDVEATARRIRNFRYAEEWIMLMLGGWLATIPEVPVKTGLGKIIWEGAQAADALGRRLPELRCGRASVAASESANAGLRGADPGGGGAGAARPHHREARGPVRRAEAASGRGLRAHGARDRPDHRRAHDRDPRGRGAPHAPAPRVGGRGARRACATPRSVASAGAGARPSCARSSRPAAA